MPCLNRQCSRALSPRSFLGLAEPPAPSALPRSAPRPRHGRPGLTAWTLNSAAGPCPCPLHPCLGLLWPVCPCSQALACGLDSSRLLGPGCHVPAPIPPAIFRPGEPVPTPLPTRAVWCVQPVLISILPSSPCSNPPPLHRPPYCNSTVPPSSPGPYCRAFDQQQHRCTSRTWLPTPTSVHHQACSWTWPHCSLLALIVPLRRDFLPC